jgi:hypothetical protein
MALLLFGGEGVVHARAFCSVELYCVAFGKMAVSVLQACSY